MSAERRWAALALWLALAAIAAPIRAETAQLAQTYCALRVVAQCPNERQCTSTEIPPYFLLPVYVTLDFEAGTATTDGVAIRVASFGRGPGASTLLAGYRDENRFWTMLFEPQAKRLTLTETSAGSARILFGSCEPLAREDRQALDTRAFDGRGARQYDRAAVRRGMAQSGSAPALGAGSREFESPYPDQFPFRGKGIARLTEV